METAAWWRCDGTRQFTRDQFLLLALFRVGHRYGTEEKMGIWMPGMCKSLLCWATLEDLPQRQAGYYKNVTLATVLRV